MKAACPRGHPYPQSLRPGRNDCAECHREDETARYHRNPERHRKKASEWQRNNRQRATERQQRWRDENRDHVRAWFREYRRKHYRSRAERAEVGYLLLDPCSYCGGEAGEVDHIEPRARGGIESWENLTSACRHCNAEKSDAPLLVFLLKRAMELAA